ncbi:hypothetical protein, partial [Aphanothece microscopica]|uniref:hypothetical protein n=1 Tax=Aphanothece microscopica TaxID=1049561 RepID=UPI003CE590E1
MLRMIISVYKVMLLIGSLLALVTIIWGGLVALIEGATPFERGSGLGAIGFGTFSVIIIAGA